MELPGEYSRGPTIGYEWKKLELRTVLIPSIRSNTTSILVNDKLYLIGGRGGGLFNEVWSLNLQDRLWELVQYQGDPPSPRDSHSANKLCDNSIVVFGGRGPCNSDRAERALETQKIKCVTQREVYNDMFTFNCDEKKWSPIVRKSRWPAGRRGHTATFVPPEPQTKHSNKHKAKISFQDDNVNTKGLLVIFGGGSVDAAWGTEQIMNELWIYNFDSESWTNQKARGNIPPPVYDHTAALVGEQIFFVGGIVAPHRPQQYVDPEESFDSKAGETKAGSPRDSKGGDPNAQVYLNGDVLSLNVKTWTWSTIELRSKLLQPVNIGLHGHTMVIDPHDTHQLIIFGGKETGDLKSLVESKLSSKSLPSYGKRLQAKNPALVLNLNERTLCTKKSTNASPEPRYGHCCVSFPVPLKPVDNEPSELYRSFFQKPSDALSLGESVEESTEDIEENVLFVFGGSRANDAGFCPPDVHVLVRTTHWPDPNSAEERRVSLNLHDLVRTPSEVLSQNSDMFAVMSQSSTESSPREIEGSVARQRLMQQALMGKASSSYEDVKRALLISRCVRESNTDLEKFSFNKWETTSRSSRNSRLSRRSKGSRKAGNTASSRPFTAPVPGSFMGSVDSAVGAGSGECNQEELAEQVRRQRQAKVQGLAHELPPLIGGMTLTQARKQYRKLHPPPSRESVFGESEFGLTVYDVLQDRTLSKSLVSKKSADTPPMLRSRTVGTLFRPQSM